MITSENEHEHSSRRPLGPRTDYNAKYTSTSVCYVPFCVNSLENDLLGLRRVLSVWSKDLANRAGDSQSR